MRIAFFSDVHANLPALEAVIEDARARGATHVICLGDIVGYGPQPSETLARLRAVADAVVMGNHDAAACGLLDPALFNDFARETAERAALALGAEDKVWLRSLPYDLEAEGIACAHGSLDSPAQFHYLETKADAALSFSAKPGFPLLVVGHTHLPCVFVQEHGEIRKLPPADFTLRPDARYLINPGSVGFPRGDTVTADYALFDTVTRHVLFLSLNYDLSPYRLAIVRNGYNLLNYWFLSPSARRRQAEQAFRSASRPAAAPIGDTAPFHSRPTKRNPSWSLWVIAFLSATLVVLLLGLLWQMRRIETPAPAPAPTAERPAPEAENLVSNLFAWTFSEKSGCGIYPERERDGGEVLRLTPLSTDAKPEGGVRCSVLSPFYPLAPGTEMLRVQKRVEGLTPNQTDACAHTVRLLFFREDGSQRLDSLHKYKRTGEQTFTARVPEGTTAFRVSLTFDLLSPIRLHLPHITPTQAEQK